MRAPPSLRADGSLRSSGFGPLLGASPAFPVHSASSASKATEAKKPRKKQAKKAPVGADKVAEGEKQDVGQSKRKDSRHDKENSRPVKKKGGKARRIRDAVDDDDDEAAEVALAAEYRLLRARVEGDVLSLASPVVPQPAPLEEGFDATLQARHSKTVVRRGRGTGAGGRAGRGRLARSVGTLGALREEDEACGGGGEGEGEGAEGAPTPLPASAPLDAKDLRGMSAAQILTLLDSHSMAAETALLDDDDDGEEDGEEEGDEGDDFEMGEDEEDDDEEDEDGWSLSDDDDDDEDDEDEEGVGGIDANP
jgi:hypothetical protein